MASFVQKFGTCPGVPQFDDAEIYLRGWQRHHYSAAHDEGLIEIGTDKVSFNPVTNELTWDLVVGSFTAIADETEYRVNFEVLLTTSGTSAVTPVLHSCSSGSDTCSAVATIPWNSPTVVPVGLALSHFTLSPSGGVPVKPKSMMVDVANYSYNPGSQMIDSSLACGFGNGGGIRCETRSVLVALDSTEGNEDHQTLFVQNAPQSAEDPYAYPENVSTAFRLCGHEAFSIETAGPTPTGIWGLWAGANGTDPKCGEKKIIPFGGFETTWWHFWGAEWNPPGLMFTPGVDTDSVSGLTFDEAITILSARVW